VTFGELSNAGSTATVRFTRPLKPATLETSTGKEIDLPAITYCGKSGVPIVKSGGTGGLMTVTVMVFEAALPKESVTVNVTEKFPGSKNVCDMIGLEVSNESLLVPPGLPASQTQRYDLIPAPALVAVLVEASKITGALANSLTGETVKWGKGGLHNTPLPRGQSALVK